MAEYIEREAAIAIYEDDAVDMSVLKVPVPVIIQNLKDVPAADVVPVRHAYWRHYDTTIGGTKLYVCSLCDGDSKTENEIRRCLYCPNCGSRMDKDGDA